MSSLKLQRLQNANDLIRVISQHGRRFFWNEAAQRTATLELDERGRVWIIDDYKGARVYTHKAGFGNGWVGFSHGGTLRSLVEAMRDYILTGESLNRERIAPARLNPGSNIWGYSTEAAVAVREAAFKLPIMDKEIQVTYNKPDVQKMQAECNAFNSQNPVGTKVMVQLDGRDEPFETVTRSTAQILSGHSAVIWLEGVSGCYLLDRVTPEVPICSETFSAPSCEPC